MSKQRGYEITVSTPELYDLEDILYAVEKALAILDSRIEVDGVEL